MNQTIFAFRQVYPSKDNLAAKSLSEHAQARNIRKVKVNAQMTFVIYVLETVANISIYIPILFVYRSNSSMSLTLGVLWFMVILPYTFLMNTSHNKNLVTDEGWWNTIRNTFGRSQKANASSNLITKNSIFTDSVQEDKSSISEKKADNTVRIGSYRTQNHRKLDCDGTKQVYTICKENNYPSTKEKCWGDGSKYLDPQPGTSKVITDVSKKVGALDACFLRQNVGRESSDEDDENLWFPTKSRRLCIGEKILSYMMSNINNERAYVHYLNQLSLFEQHLKKKNGASNEFDIVHDIDTASTTNLLLNLKGKSLDRIEIRKILLQGFEEHCHDEEAYEVFLNLLFDREEDFIHTRF